MLKKYILPIFVILLCIVILLAGGAFFIFLTQYDTLHPAKNVQHDALSVVLLDETWAEETFASEATETQQTAIAQSLALVQAMGGNAVALTARMPNGDALWRDKTETLTTYQTITKTDHFFAKFDALNHLIKTASSLDIEVILLPTAQDGTLLDDTDALPAYLSELTARYGLRCLYEQPITVMLDSSEAEGDDAPKTENLLGVAQNTTTYAYQLTANNGTVTTLYRNDTSPVTLAQELQATNTHAVVLGEYTALCADGTARALFLAYYADGEPLPDLAGYLGSDYARTLAVSYPTENGSTVNNQSLFLMGTSNPNEPLTLNDTEIVRHGTKGVWGILLTLETGENTFTLVNGSDTLDYTVTYTRKDSGGSTNSGTAKYYDVAEGQTVMVTADIASALSNAYSSSSITQTFYKGAVIGVTRYLSYADSTEPYAYQLTTGDYLRASTCSLYNTTKTHLTEENLVWNNETRATNITLLGGTPAVYHKWEGNTLTLTLTTASYGGSTLNSDWFSSTVSDDGQNTIFTFTFTEEQPLYGWAVNYNTDANTTTLTLKQQPHLNEDETLPLSGVRVLLDAGHGSAEDLGAMGAAGMGAPCEKDVNLALTMATKYRLEQLGATVLLTREDDSFPSLGDRVTALNTLHPDFFISVHHNSLELVSDLNTATGVEAYWFYDEADVFANQLMETVSAAANRATRSVKYGYYYVTRSNICPATLLEVGFMTNPWEYESLSDTDVIWSEAGAIAQTIYDTVAQNG